MEYQRKETLAYHAVRDIFRGKIVGRVAPNTCIAAFNQLIDLVMTQSPYQTSGQTFWMEVVPIIGTSFQRN
jgi:hypothetical protein